jgi:FTR1 family protein
MIESLVVTLREGVEAALVVGILIAYLNRVGRPELDRYVYWAVLAAVAGSIVGAYLLQDLAVNEEALEGVLLLIAAVFVLTFLLWMHQAAKHIRAQIETRVDRILARGSPAAVGAGLFLFTFVMVFREGVETAIFLGAISISTSTLWSLFGGVIGLALALVFAVLFVRGSVRIDLRRFFQVTEVVLFIFVVQLLINSYHELSEAGWAPATPRSMAIVGPIVSNNVLFIISILAIPVLVLFFSRSADRRQVASTMRGPEWRKLRAAEKKVARTRRAAALVGLSLVAFLSLDFVYSSDSPELEPPVPIEATNGVVAIPVAAVDDGQLHRFSYDVGEISMRILVIRIEEGRYATALDACPICGKIGYYQEEDRVICINCQADIYIPTIGQEGGCNPIPIPSENVGDAIVLNPDVLAKNAEVFR